MPRARAIDAFVAWALSIVLAALFLLTGVSKLLGVEAANFQAVTMAEFPSWVRVLVGCIEVAGAIGLLVPAIATPAALILALLMLPATVAQYMRDPSGLWMPLVVLALLLFLLWRRNAKSVSDRYRGYRARSHSLLYEGVIAGVIGAAVIAVWFFIIDAIAGRPFYTPAVLGRGLLAIFGPLSVNDGAVSFVLLYTVFHVAAFMLVGLVTSLVVQLARREPSILFAFIILFVAAELGIYMFVALLDVATPLGRFAWLQIMAGNVLAAAAMGYYFLRTHRELGDEFRHSLDWEAAAPQEPRPPVLTPATVPPSPNDEHTPA
jgi:putative oxidoreductase